MMTPAAILLRIKHQKEEAIKHFKGNPYVTIHDYSSSASKEKSDPFTVWIDVNFPVYILNGDNPELKKDGIKDICIKYSTGYPENRPFVSSPVNVASVHCWSDRHLCCYTNYNPQTHSLILEINSIITLCANCPETINYHSMTDQGWLEGWIKTALGNKAIPTISKNDLIKFYPVSTRRKAIIT